MCMFRTCDHVHHMTMIQIRNVPEELHRRLKARAAMAGVSLSDLLLQEIKAVAERPTLEEMRLRLSQLSPIVTEMTSAEAVRAERDSR